MSNHWLWTWGDCVRGRDSSKSGAKGPYTRRRPDKTDYRPQDDPHPTGFIFMQVEKVLGDRDGARWRLAHHLWVERKPISKFTELELGIASLYRMRRSIVQQLARDIRLWAPETITEAAVEVARKRSVLERKRG